MGAINVNGTPWAPDTNRLALTEIRTQAIAELRQRDERLSRGRMNAENNYAPYDEIVSEREVDRGEKDLTKVRESRFRLNPALVEIKHSGAETQSLVKKRWADFCLVPRDEKPYREQLDTVRRAERLAAMQAGGEEVERSLAAEPVAVAVAEPPKRGPGRPAGSKNRAKIEM